LVTPLLDLVEEWELRYDGDPRQGYCSLVVPVRTTGGRPAVLKVAFPDDENEPEHLALQRWQGNGAVTLLRADPRRHALLLERLHVPAPAQLRPLTASVDRWNAGLAALSKEAPMPRRLVEQGSRWRLPSSPTRRAPAG